MNELKKLFIGLIVLVFTSSSYAQLSGDLDVSFNTANGLYPNSNGPNGSIPVMATQSDGKILIAGAFTTYNTVSRNKIARLNADGTLDTSFDSSIGANNEIRSLVLQPDGKVLIGGEFTFYDGIPVNRIARLNPNGSLDLSFNPGSGADSSVYAVSLQSDGKVLIGGNFSNYNGVARIRIARLLSDGSLDLDFNPIAGANGLVRTIVAQSDGGALIGGDFTYYNGMSSSRIVRVLPDGLYDSSFVVGTGFNNSVSTVALQADGKILIGGTFLSYNGVSRVRITRLNADGSLDTSFNPGTGVSANVLSIVIQPNGQVLIGGLFTFYNSVSRNRVARINTDGTLDTSFGQGVSYSGANSSVNTIVINHSGKILVGGTFTLYNGISQKYIAQINLDGSSNPLLNTGLGANSSVSSVVVQPDGKALIGGNFTSYNATGRNYIARCNTDGSSDTSFLSNIGANGAVSSIALQADGKILIGGDFTMYNGFSSNRIARLNVNGTLDSSFLAGAIGANANVASIVIQPDGKILVGGAFTTFAGSVENYIVRLNTDGSIDSTFSSSNNYLVASATVSSIVLQPDGKILIGASFTTYDGVSRNGIARLNSNGSLDVSFDLGIGANNMVYAVCLQPDGKILVGGSFTLYGGANRLGIIRLNNDGSIDSSFVGTGASNVRSIVLQSNGKILIGGNFVSYNGTSRNRIARLNADGTLDTDFTSGTGANTQISSMALQPDGNVLIGGLFTSYRGVFRDYIARVFTSPCVAPQMPTASDQSFCGSATVANLVGTGTNLRWYAAASGGVALVANTALSTTTYYVTQTIGGCESNRLAVSVTLTPATTIGSESVSACGSSYVWPVSGATYNASGSYDFVSGCNTATLTLSLNTEVGIYYADTDGDGFGAGAPIESCTGQPEGASTDNTDCAPENALAWRIDNFFVDADGDGYNNGFPAAPVCYGALTPAGYTSSNIGTDCGNDDNALQNPNASEILENGIDDNCDGSIDEVTPLSSLIASSCGVTLTNLSNTLFAYPLSNFITEVGQPQGYRFRVTNGTTVRTFDSPTNGFALTSLVGGATYATTYTVEVSVKTQGHFRAYGAACTVTTPGVPYTTSISNPSCGSTLTDITATIFCTPVASASGYRFRVRNGATLVGVFNSPVNRFSLTNIGISNITFGTTYTVDVLLAFGGNFRPDSEYGDACSITTPATPATSRVIQPTCGSSISNLWTTIFAQQVIGAQGYKFVVTNGAQTREFNTPNPRFSLQNLAGGAAANTAYTIRVDVLYASSYVQGTVLCTITTTPGATRQTASALDIYEVTVYPNPYADTFKLDVNTSSEDQVGVSVYDMLGREVEARQASVSNITNLEIGSQYPSGVYNIIVTQGDNVKTLRVIKR